MSLDLTGFITPEKQYQGLYEIGNNARQDARLNMMYGMQEARLQRMQNAQKDATANYLRNYLNPKNYFTGTPEDPIISGMLGDTMHKAFNYASQGMNASEISFLISPQMDKLATASSNLKAINAQLKQVSPALKKIAGFDPESFDKSFKQNAYYNPDGTLKDLSQIDPTENYVDKTLSNSDVWTPKALEQYTYNATPKKPDVNSLTNVSSNGKTVSGKFEYIKPTFMQPEMNNGVYQNTVPKYELATDEGNVLNHKYGEQQGNPVRLLDSGEWNSLLQDPASHGYIFQEVRKLSGGKVDPTSPQGEMLGRAIAYDELNRIGQKGVSVKNIQVNKQAPIRSYSFYHGSAANQPVQTTDYAGQLQNQIQSNTQSGYDYTPFNETSAPTQNYILGQARTITGQKNLTPADVYYKQGKNGIELWQVNGNKPDTTKDTFIMNVDPNQLNLGANTSTLKAATNKGKVESVNRMMSGGNKTKTPSVKTTSKGLPILGQ